MGNTGVIARIGTLVTKELREFRTMPAAIIPVIIVVVVTLLIPFFVLVALPKLTGENLADDPVVAKAIGFAVEHSPALVALPPESAAQAFLFQQFLLRFLIAPIAGAVTLAAHSVVGEKQGRTLEPLLTTPLTTAELLVGKVLAAVLPALLIELLGVLLYFGLVAVFAAPGVFSAVVAVRTAVLLLGIGPAASLVALQGAIAISSRVNDSRSAQQIAILVLLPLIAMLVGQIMGAFVITTAVLVGLTIGLLGIWLLLVMLSVALFDRESILTRWK